MVINLNASLARVLCARPAGGVIDTDGRALGNWPMARTMEPSLKTYCPGLLQKRVGFSLVDFSSAEYTEKYTS